MGTSGAEESKVQFSQPATRSKAEKSHRTDHRIDFADLEHTAGKRTPRSTRFEAFTRSNSVVSEAIFKNSKEDPGLFSFFSAKSGESVSITGIKDLILPDGSLSGLFDNGSTRGAWWLDVLNPTEEEVDALVKAFFIHPLTEEDIKMPVARERIELFKHYYYACYHSFYRSGKAGDLKSFNVHVIVFREGTLSLAFCKRSRHAANVRTRMTRLKNFVTFTSDWISYAILDDIIDSFALLMNEIDKETNAIEDDVSIRGANDSDALLMQIHNCRQKVMSITRLLNGKASIVKSLTNFCGRDGPAAPHDDIRPYLSDIQDHIVTMISNLHHFDEILIRSRSCHLAQVSAEMFRAKNQIFQTISKCSTVAVIFVALYLICGLWGMNVPVPGQTSEGLGWWLGISGVVMAGTLVSVIMARRKKLI
ncbi:Mg(2+) transporter [Orbilia brochopaga]|uniref:Mg(2+) transporter n=1 Tax=Orbilia brochopaga TaxID=3140254 RepID=A0AAV9VBP8_9PEZI